MDGRAEKTYGYADRLFQRLVWKEDDSLIGGDEGGKIRFILTHGYRESVLRDDIAVL